MFGGNNRRGSTVLRKQRFYCIFIDVGFYNVRKQVKISANKLIFTVLFAIWRANSAKKPIFTVVYCVFIDCGFKNN